MYVNNQCDLTHLMIILNFFHILFQILYEVSCVLNVRFHFCTKLRVRDVRFLPFYETSCVRIVTVPPEIDSHIGGTPSYLVLWQ